MSMLVMVFFTSRTVLHADGPTRLSLKSALPQDPFAFMGSV